MTITLPDSSGVGTITGTGATSTGAGTPGAGATGTGAGDTGTGATGTGTGAIGVGATGPFTTEMLYVHLNGDKNELSC